MEEQTNNKPKEGINFTFNNNWIVASISLFLTLPIFLIIKKSIPSLNWPLYIDVILLFFLLWGLVSLLVKPFKRIIYGILIFFFVALIYGSFFDSYGFGSFLKDYKQLLKEMKTSSNPSKTFVYKLTPVDINPFVDILDNISTNDDIKQKAQIMSIKFFNNYYEEQSEDSIYLRSFSIYKSVKQEWTYIRDLSENEHYTASEILKDMNGDYDEYTVIMCSLIESIGGKVNILYKNKNEMHPLLLIGKQKDESKIKNMIKENFKESFKKQIGFFRDNQGRSWLVLSFFHNYPGGKFLNKSEYKIVEVK